MVGRQFYESENAKMREMIYNWRRLENFGLNPYSVDLMKDFKVLELASVLAGPGVGQFFAELGASVIKVENLATGGDVTRSWKISGEQTDDRSAYFCSVNWGKRSVALDLNTSDGRRVVHTLASKADLVIASYKPGDAEKLAVDYKTLSKLNPGLIYSQVTGYGSSNPRVGYDAVLQAEAGFMFMNGVPGGPSLKMPVAMVDILAGHHLKEAILLAMLEKTKTGKGKFVEVSLIQAAVSSLANQATNWLVAHQLPQKHGSAHPNIAPYGDMFKTKDDLEILLAVGSDRQFQDLCDVLKIAGIADDKKFSTNQRRVENRLELHAILQNGLGQYTAAALMEELNRKKIPAGIIQHLQQVFGMPEAKELLMDSDGVMGVRNFVGKDAGDWMLDSGRSILPPPHFGEHTEEVLREISAK
jgi:crotonobetainyl-CoA:carnitine CoA-transferase CaiB-like acyl-CoA transferase